MLKNVKDEITRSPIASICAVIGLLIGGISLFLAWMQSQNGSPSFASTPLGGNFAPNLLNVTNMLLAISFYLGGTFAIATGIRILSRQHTFAAISLSIPLAALMNFLTLLVIYLAPPRDLNAKLLDSASELVLYGTATIFVAFCGQAVMLNLLSPAPTEENAKEDRSGDAIGALFFGGILLAIWCGMVSFGQSRLTTTFLPTIT